MNSHHDGSGLQEGAKPKTCLLIPLKENVTWFNMAGAFSAICIAMFGMLLNAVIYQDFLVTYCGMKRTSIATGVGNLILIYSVCYLVSASFWGWLSDKYGRRKITVICFILMGLTYLAMGLTRSFGTMVVVRIALGLVTSGGMAVCMAAAADYCVPRYRGKLMGTIGTLIGLGATIGIIFGPIFYKSYYYYVFSFQGLALFISAVIAYTFLQKGVPHIEGGHPGMMGADEHSQEKLKPSKWRFFKEPKLRLAYGVSFLLGGGMQLSMVLFYPWGQYVKGASMKVLSGYSATSSLLFTVLVVFAGSLVIKVGRLRMIFIGLIGYAATMFIMAVMNDIKTVGWAYILTSIFQAGIYPVALAYAASLVKHNERGLSMGIYHSMRSAGELTFLIVCPRLLDSYGKLQGFMFPTIIALVLFAYVIKIRFNERKANLAKVATN